MPAMTYRRLGTSNLQVSALCLGTMLFGKQTPLDDPASIVASARDHGINFIDTADVYNHGQSEKDLSQPPPRQKHTGWRGRQADAGNRIP